MKKLALCSLAVVAVAASTSMALANQAKWDKDNSPAPAGTRGLLDCSNAIDAGCGFTYSGTNGSGVNNVAAYNCQPFDESGPELVFALNIGSTSNVDIIMDTDGTDLDLFLLASCDENDCIGSSASIDHEEIHAQCLDAGTYYVVVDGYSGNVGGFTLSIGCTDCNPPAGNETCSSALTLDCGNVSLTTDTSGSANDYNPGAGNSCTGFSASGGDLVWSLCIPDGGAAHFTFAEIDYDASVYMVTDCTNLVGTCLDGDDCFPFPCNDLINYTNSTGNNVNAYLIIDGFGGETGHGSLTGTLDCCGAVAVEKTTVGGIKAKYSR